MRLTSSLIAILLVAGGCMNNENDNGAIQPVSRDAVDSLNSQHNKFDSVKDPEFTASTRFAAGQLAESQKNPGAAIEQYKLAIKLDKNHQPSLYRLGVLYAQIQRYPDAIATWKQYVNATNQSATAYGNLAFCYEVANQRSDAEAAYKAGLQRDPKNLLCRQNYGLMLARMGRIDEAKTQLSAVLKPAQVHYNLGSVYEITGRKDDAKSEYEQALQLDSSFWDAKNRLDRLDRVSSAQ